MRVSVIVPVYNRIRYIKECVESVKAQTYSDWELILVDDASADGSAEYCDETTKDDKRIRVIRNNTGKRRGVSKNRNIGLEAAAGELIMFLDSDDYIAPQLMEYAVKSILDNNLDIYIYRYRMFKNDLEAPKLINNDHVEIYDSTHAIEEMFAGSKFRGLCWNKVCKRSLYDNVRFPEDRRYGEDIYVTCRLLHNAKRIMYADRELYFYRIHNESAMHGIIKEDVFTRVKAYEELIEWTERHYSHMVDMAYNAYCNIVAETSFMLRRSDTATRQIVMRKIHVSVRDKIEIITQCDNISHITKAYMRAYAVTSHMYTPTDLYMKYTRRKGLKYIMGETALLREPILKIKKLRHALYIKSCCMQPLQKNKIILWANSFKQYGCSPKYITEYLLKEYPGEFDIVWVFEPQVTIPEGLDKRVRVVRYFSMEYLKELHTAKFVICNMRTGDAYYWHKRKGQVYIQTWHSSIRLKKIEKDAEQCFDENYIRSAIEDSKKIDLLLSGCEFSTEIFERAFWYSGDIMKSGTPRCDIFFNDTEETKKKVFDHYNIAHDKCIVIYAPTFRKDKSADMHGINEKQILAALQERFGGDWVFMYRFHPNIISSYSFDIDNAVDASKYPDMQELITASDLMITDYSSCMFDMLIAGKPCLLYAPDADEYSKDERGLYFEFNELPFPLAKTNGELENEISNFDEDKYIKNCTSFMEKIGSYETGHASERVAEYIKEKMYG